MKKNFIHVCFIIDESSSMYGSESDIIGGFNKTIKEQREVKDGQCSVSFFSFADNVVERFIGKDVNEVKELTNGNMFGNKFYSHSSFLSLTSSVVNGVADVNVTINEDESNPLYQYCPNGCTAMNDGIGTAIDRIGRWLSDMEEDERPSKNLIVIMTDGEENSSKEYSLAKVQDMIKHQTEKYDWSFVYMGMDISNSKTADDLGINTRSFSSKNSTHMYKNYSNISEAASVYRSCTCSSYDASLQMDTCLQGSLGDVTKEYENMINAKIG